MTKLVITAAIAVLLGPAAAGAQSERVGGTKQKAWMVSNFQSGLSECSVLRDGEGFSVSGAAVLSFVDLDSDNDGYDFSVNDVGSSVPVIAAHAINTKGTGSQNGRSAGQACDLMPSPRGTIPSRGTGAVAGIGTGAAAGIVVASCSVSGDPDAPIVRFRIPLSSFGGAAAKTYVGHFTVIKREASMPSVSEFMSKKSYDSYRARSDVAWARTQLSPGSIPMKVIATCDASSLLVRTGATRTGYDLAVGKKV